MKRMSQLLQVFLFLGAVIIDLETQDLWCFDCVHFWMLHCILYLSKSKVLLKMVSIMFLFVYDRTNTSFILPVCHLFFQI